MSETLGSLHTGVHQPPKRSLQHSKIQIIYVLQLHFVLLFLFPLPEFPLAVKTHFAWGKSLQHAFLINWLGAHMPNLVPGLLHLPEYCCQGLALFSHSQVTYEIALLALNVISVTATSHLTPPLTCSNVLEDTASNSEQSMLCESTSMTFWHRSTLWKVILLEAYMYNVNNVKYV